MVGRACFYEDLWPYWHITMKRICFYDCIEIMMQGLRLFRVVLIKILSVNITIQERLLLIRPLCKIRIG